MTFSVSIELQINHKRHFKDGSSAIVINQKNVRKFLEKKRLVVCTFGRLQGQKNLPNSAKTIYSHLENCPKFLEPRFPLIANVINESFLIEITQTFQYKLHPTEPLNKLTLLSRGGWTLRFRGLSGTDFL